MRRFVWALALISLAAGLSGCPFFTRSEHREAAPAEAPSGEAGHE